MSGNVSSTTSEYYRNIANNALQNAGSFTGTPIDMMKSVNVNSYSQLNNYIRHSLFGVPSYVLASANWLMCPGFGGVCPQNSASDLMNIYNFYGNNGSASGTGNSGNNGIGNSGNSTTTSNNTGNNGLGNGNATSGNSDSFDANSTSYVAQEDDSFELIAEKRFGKTGDDAKAFAKAMREANEDKLITVKSWSGKKVKVIPVGVTLTLPNASKLGDMKGDSKTHYQKDASKEQARWNEDYPKGFAGKLFGYFSEFYGKNIKENKARTEEVRLEDL